MAEYRLSPAAGCGLEGIWEYTYGEWRLEKAERYTDLNDTSAEIADLVADRHRSMTPTERWMAARSLFETARKIIESSLPGDLTLEQRRLAVVRRLYQNELLEAALIAHARYVDSATSP